MATALPADDEFRTDMTPMIDVVFLLIVFFLCIEFKVLEARLDAFLPTDRGSQPRSVQPKEQLVVRVHVAEEGREARDRGRPGRYRLVGHRVRVEVGAVPCPDLAACETELRRLARDPAMQVPDANQGLRPMPLVVEGFAGTRYDDIARTADLCRAAGFHDITFGGGVAPR